MPDQPDDVASHPGRTPEETPQQCTKCDQLLDTTGYPLWCKSCRAKHKREYEATKKEMQESRGYCAGMSAMREYLASKFQQYGSAGSFTGYEIAATIRQCAGPR